MVIFFTLLIEINYALLLQNNQAGMSAIVFAA